MPPPHRYKLTFDLLTLKVVSESRVTWARPTSVPILVFLGLSVLDLGSMYATDSQTDRCQTDVRRASSLNASALWGIIIETAGTWDHMAIELFVQEIGRRTTVIT